MSAPTRQDRHDELAKIARRFPEGTVLLDRYTLRHIIGEGAMGTVYHATQVMDGAPVAVKVEHHDPEHAFEGRFEREASLMAQVRHANVARLLDFGRLPDGGGVLVMEFIDGESVDHVLERCGGSVAWREAVAIGLGLLDGLAAVHNAGVIHRDIKPSNVVLERGASPTVKLVDFGVARRLQGGKEARPLTGAGEVLGTLNYMSPEQLMGERIDSKSDLYAVGVMLYQSLCGALPFDPRAMKGTVEKTTGCAPRPMRVPADREPWPEQVELAVLRALSFAPAERFTTAEHFAATLRAAMHDAVEPRETVRKSGANLVALDAPTRPFKSTPPEKQRRVVVVATRLPPGTLDDEQESAWISELLAGFARPVELGGDTIGIVLNEGGTGQSANIAVAMVDALSRRYGRLNVALERVAVREGWSIDVLSLVSIATKLLEKIDAQQREG